MKRLLIMMAAVSLLAVSCKKEENTENRNKQSKEKTCYDRTKGDKPFVIPKEFNNKALFANDDLLIAELEKLKLSQVYLVLDANKSLVKCTPAVYSFVEELHSLHGDQAFFEYLQRKDANNPHPNYKYAIENWSSMLEKIDDLKLKCNNGWLEVDYVVSPNPANDDTINFTATTTFTLDDKTFYTEMLFKGIDNKIKSEGGTPEKVYFTKAYCAVTVLDVCNDLAKIIFKVEYTDKDGNLQFEYYDMSDYPM